MGKRILIVDDERNIVTALDFLLELNGYEVRSAHDGEEALSAAAAFAPDLILLDVMLPRRSGFEVLQKIRETTALPDVKVIMLTAKGREVEIGKGLALGADAYITKPFSTRDLLMQVRQLLGEGT